MFLLTSCRRKLLWWALFTLSLTGYLLYLAVHTKPVKPQYDQAIKRQRFLEKHNWQQELAKQTVDRTLFEQPAIPESFLISESIEGLFALIIQEFVDSWFTKISSSRLFQDSIQVELKHVVQTLKERVSGVNFANLLVFKVVPLLTDQYAQFVSSARKHDSSHSIEGKLNAAISFGRSRIHDGVSLSIPGKNSREKEKEYLRRKIGAILPFLLSEQENSNSTVLLLVRELLACTVLANVFEVLSEGDFFNQMIVKLIGANLQHRDQVKRLRAVLREHTASNTHAKSVTIDKTLPSSQVSQWLDQIDKADSSEEIEALNTIIKGKQDTLSDNAANSDVERQQLAVLSERITRKLQSSEISAVTLESILSDRKQADVFREYLRKFKHEADIDLWQAIDRMKAPLETVNGEQVSLLLEFSNEDDILRIYSSFFSNASIPISDKIRGQIESYVKCSDSNEDKAELYQQARKALFVLQDDIAQHMKNHHFTGFQRSNRYGDLELNKNSSRVRREASLAFGGSKFQKYLSDVDLQSDQISPGVVQAVETAFENIMKSSRTDGDSKSLFTFNETPQDKNLDEKPNLFGDNSGLFSENGSQEEFSPNPNRMSALFDDGSDSNSDSESVTSDNMNLSTELSDSKLSTLEIILAAPGDLSLAEQIATLDKNIENLTEQDAILGSLIKKAELTNNVPELRVLRKSKLSLEREISSKELQKQQYIVQENENSLYGKSKVQIQSCVFGKDDSASYVLYIIEVQKYSSEDPNEIVAGWVVARRFSQFYKLNEYLKRRCPEVSNIKFPKKTVPMLKFQKAQQVEMRKPVLELYLRSLLKIPEVCSDPAFRSFLSSEEFSIGAVPGAKSKNFDAFFNRFYGKISQRVPVVNTMASLDNEEEEMLANIQEMERELKQYDDMGKEGFKMPFVKPISDLLMTVFDLRNSQSWLRGRALLVILQQVLGSTIEKTITQQVDANLRQEEKLLDVLGLLENMLFPNKKFRESPEIRTKSEQTSTRQEANAILRVFMNETCAKVFGFKNTNHASTELFEMFQNDFLNKLLFFKVLDELLLEVFPEADYNH